MTQNWSPSSPSDHHRFRKPNIEMIAAGCQQIDSLSFANCTRLSQGLTMEGFERNTQPHKAPSIIGFLATLLLLRLAPTYLTITYSKQVSQPLSMHPSSGPNAKQESPQLGRRRDLLPGLLEVYETNWIHGYL